MKKNFKKRLAMVLAAAMVFSTPVAVNKTVSVAAEKESAYETLTGTAWWTGSQKGKDYSVNANSTTVLYVEAQALDNGDGAFNVEVQGVVTGKWTDQGTEKDGGYFFTTGSDKNAWTAEVSAGVGTISGIPETKNSELVEGHIYKITVKREAKDITLSYFDTTANESYCEFKWTDGNMPEEANVHIIAQVGTYNIYDNDPTPVSVTVTGPAIKADKGSRTIDYSFAAVNAPENVGFEVSVSKDNVVVATGSAVVAENNFTYSYPQEGGTLESGRYTFKVTGIEAAENDKTNYVLNGDAAESVEVTVTDGVITGSVVVDTVKVKVTDGNTALSDDKASINYSFKAENAPENAEFEVSVSKGDTVVATGSAAVADSKWTYKPTESGKYTFKVTGIKVAEDDTKEYVLVGDAAKEIDFTVPTSTPPTTNPPTSNPPTSNPPTSNPPTSNPPATSQGTVKKVTVKAANQKAGTKTVYLKKGGKVTLTATVTGTGKFSKAVTWTSSKKAVATVSSKGVVKAKKAGTAKITVASKTDKTKKATITIKVSKKAKKNKKLTLKAKSKSLKKGKTYTVAIKSMTKGTTDAVTYKTSKKSVATVDKFGVVKAKKKGSATITVKCGKKSAKLKIKVK